MLEKNGTSLHKLILGGSYSKQCFQFTIYFFTTIAVYEINLLCIILQATNFWEMELFIIVVIHNTDYIDSTTITLYFPITNHSSYL